MGVQLSCHRCNERDAYFRVTYENSDIDELNITFADYIGKNEKFCRVQYIITEAEFIVGNISWSVPAALEVRISQVLCYECEKEVKFDELSDEWGYEVKHVPGGCKRFDLP